MDDFDSLSSEEIESKIADLGLLEERHHVIPVLSLQDMVFKAILSHMDYFDKKLGNPLTNLPHNLAQGLLTLAKDPSCPCKNGALLVKMLLTAPNNTITSLDVTSMYRLGLCECDDFVQMALDNCPRLEHVSAPCPLRVSASKKETDQLALSMVTNWSKMRNLDLMGFYPTDKAVKLIVDKLPQLERMSLCMNRQKLTEDGVKVFCELKRLTFLDVYMLDYDDELDFFRPQLVIIAGMLPSLQILHLKNNMHKSLVGSDFVECYSECYPEKKIALKELIMMVPLRCMWSHNLQVAELCLYGSAVDYDMGFHRLSNMPCGVTELTLYNFIDPDKVYKLLELTGASLKMLRLTELPKCSHRIPFILNLSKVMALCPALEHFSTSSLMLWRASDPSAYNLTPESFSNIKAFNVEGECPLLSDEDVKAFLKLFKMVLTGSKFFPILELQNSILLKETAMFLNSNPVYPARVEVFNVRCDEKTDLKNAMTISKLLMTRSPYLHRVQIIGRDREDLPHWFNQMSEALGVEVEISKTLHSKTVGYANTIYRFRRNNTIDVYNPNLLISFTDKKFWQSRYFPSALEKMLKSSSCNPS